MSFTEAVKTCFSKYVTFSGRAPRSEYWWFFLFLFLGGLVTSILDGLLFGDVTMVQTEETTAIAAETQGPIQGLFGLAVLLPHLAVLWRRMHDTGRSGLYALFPLLLSIGAGLVLVFGIGAASMFAHGGSLDRLLTGATLLILVPTMLILILSPLLVLWWLTRPSQPGTNAYGPNPHEVAQ